MSRNCEQLIHRFAVTHRVRTINAINRRNNNNDNGDNHNYDRVGSNVMYMVSGGGDYGRNRQRTMSMIIVAGDLTIVNRNNNRNHTDNRYKGVICHFFCFRMHNNLFCPLFFSFTCTLTRAPKPQGNIII